MEEIEKLYRIVSHRSSFQIVWYHIGLYCIVVYRIVSYMCLVNLSKSEFKSEQDDQFE